MAMYGTATEGLGCCAGVKVGGGQSVLIQASFAGQRDSGLSIESNLQSFYGQYKNMVTSDGAADK